MGDRRPKARLELRLLGGHRAYVGGAEIHLERRSWELLLLMLFKPAISPAEVRDHFGEVSPRRTKSRLRQALGVASHYLDTDRRLFRLTARPRIDYDEIPPDAEPALDYCLARGDLLPGLSDIAVIADERDKYHRLLQGIVAELLRQRTGREQEGLLTKVAQAQILPPPYLDVLRQRHLRLEITSRESIETTLRLLESHVHTDTVERTDTGRLMDVVSQLERTAQAWQPNAPGHIDRAAVLVRFFVPTMLSDWDDVYVKLANSYYLAADLYRAVEMLRPWLGTPGASHNAFCTAALYDLDLGYVSDAEACFDRAHTSPAPDFKLTVREKRDVQLRSLQAGSLPRALIYTAEALAKESAYNDMSPGSRASVWCNAARAADSPARALELTLKGRGIDKDSENPHYEFSLLRYARAVGDKDLAREYAGQVEELMQADRPPGFHLSLMELRADDLTRRFSESPAHDSPQHRARLEEADALLGSVYDRYQAACNVPQMCRTLIRRAQVAQQLGEIGMAYEYAAGVPKLSVTGAANRLRHVADAKGILQRLGQELDASARENHQVKGERVAYYLRRPRALTAPEEE
jgi:tetratricopeptide (TPR) repeat protein